MVDEDEAAQSSGHDLIVCLSPYLHRKEGNEGGKSKFDI